MRRLQQPSGRSPQAEAGPVFSYGHFNNVRGGGTHLGQCLRSPQLYREPGDCVSSSAAEEPVLQIAPQSPTAERSHNKMSGNLEI